MFIERRPTYSVCGKVIAFRVPRHPDLTGSTFQNILRADEPDDACYMTGQRLKRLGVMEYEIELCAVCLPQEATFTQY